MKDAMKDPRTAKLMKELARLFPGTTLVPSPMRDEPGSGTIVIEVLNAPSPAWERVNAIARPLIWKLWGDGPHPVYVRGIDREDTAKYHADDLAKARRAPAVRRRRPAARRKRAAAR
jgi:hypothetical protein